MNRFLLGAGLTLTAFVAAHLVAVGFARALASFVRRPSSAAGRAQFALALRLVPTASAILLSLLAALAFAIHEPAVTDERLSPVLLASGLLGLALALSGSWRALVSALATRRLARSWRTSARVLALRGAPAPAFAIEHPFPVVAVVGILRPRLFLAESVVRRLSPAELRAVLVHEAAHVERRDNLKRWLTRCCPGLPVLERATESLSREWENAAEEAADEHAAATGGRVARHLASALVKVARLAPTGARLSTSAIALLAEGNLRGRVERLLAAPDHLVRRPDRWARVFMLAAASLVVAGVVTLPQMLLSLHGLLEAVVRMLG